MDKTESSGAIGGLAGRIGVRGRTGTGHRLIAVYEYTPSKLPSERIKSITITQQDLSVQEVTLRIWLLKNLTIRKYNRTVTLQYGKPIPR
jgi:hypothetical protein